MTTPYDEGNSAGYLNKPKINPYDKGWQQWQNWAEDWDVGYEAGQDQRQTHTIEKYIDGCR